MTLKRLGTKLHCLSAIFNHGFITAYVNYVSQSAQRANFFTFKFESLISFKMTKQGLEWKGIISEFLPSNPPN